MSFWSSPHAAPPNPQGRARGREPSPLPPAPGSATVAGIGVVGSRGVDTQWFVDLVGQEVYVIPGDPAHDDVLAAMRSWLRQGGDPVPVHITMNAGGRPIIGE